jgi:hypothetical protein
MGCPSEDLLLVADEAPIHCALEALAGGKAGRIVWDIEIDTLSGYLDHVVLDLVGDGTAFRHGYYAEDLYQHWHAVERRSLPTQMFFAACLGAPGWQARFECIRQSLQCVELETCLEGAVCPWSVECPTV